MNSSSTRSFGRGDQVAVGVGDHRQRRQGGILSKPAAEKGPVIGAGGGALHDHKLVPQQRKALHGVVGKKFFEGVLLAGEDAFERMRKHMLQGWRNPFAGMSVAEVLEEMRGAVELPE